jgi:hypothetical protein
MDDDLAEHAPALAGAPEMVEVEAAGPVEEGGTTQPRDASERRDDAA